MGCHLGHLGLARARWAVEQDVDAHLVARHGLTQERAQHGEVIGHELEVGLDERALGGRPREHGHQVVRPLVLAHQDRWELIADLHEVGQIGDVVFGDQVLDHADAL